MIWDAMTWDAMTWDAMTWDAMTWDAMNRVPTGLDFQLYVSLKKAFCRQYLVVGDAETLVRSLFPATAHCAERANTAAVRCGRKHSSHTCFSSCF